jgi:hypothetical protein
MSNPNHGKKQLKLKYDPKGENSPNLVTLLRRNFCPFKSFNFAPALKKIKVHFKKQLPLPNSAPLEIFASFHSKLKWLSDTTTPVIRVTR